MGLLFSQPGRRTVVGNPVEDPFTTQSYVDTNFFTNDNFDNFYQNDYTAYKTSNDGRYNTLNTNYNNLSGDLSNYKTSNDGRYDALNKDYTSYKSSNDGRYDTLNTNYTTLSGDFDKYKTSNDGRYDTLNTNYTTLSGDFDKYKTSNDGRYDTLNTNYTTLSGDFDKYKTSNDDRYNTLNTDYRAYKTSSSADIETLKKSIGLELKNELTKITDSIEQQTGVSVDNYSNAFQRWLDGAYKDFLAEYTKLKTDFNSLDSNYKRIPESTIIELAKENALSKMEDRIVAELGKLQAEFNAYKTSNDGRYDALNADYAAYKALNDGKYAELNTDYAAYKKTNDGRYDTLNTNYTNLSGDFNNYKTTNDDRYNTLNTRYNTFAGADTRKLSELASQSALNDYYTKAVADSLYAPLGQYNTLNTRYNTFIDNDTRKLSQLASQSALTALDTKLTNNYSTKTTADGLYAPLGQYNTLNTNYNTFIDKDTRKLSELASQSALTNFITKDVSNLTNYVGNKAGADKFAPRDDWSRFIGGVTGAQMTYRIGDYSTKAVADTLYAPLGTFTTLNTNFNNFRDNDTRKLSELASKSALNDYYTKENVNNQIGEVNTTLSAVSKAVTDNKAAYDNFLLNDYGVFKTSGKFSKDVDINGWTIDKDGEGKMCFSSLNPATNTIEKKWCLGQNGEFYTKNMGLEQNKDMYGYIQDQLSAVPVATKDTPMSVNVKRYNFGM